MEPENTSARRELSSVIAEPSQHKLAGGDPMLALSIATLIKVACTPNNEKLGW